MAELEESKKRTRRPKPRHPQMILGSIDEIGRMLTREPNTNGIGLRITELADEMNRALNGTKEDEE